MDRATFPSAGNSLQPTDTRTFRFEGVALDLARGSLCGANGEIQLRPKSLEVLRYLVSNPGRLVAKDELLGAVWPDVTVTEESLTRCISDIRLALQDREARIIKTVPKRGYRFDAAVSVAGEHDTQTVSRGITALPVPQGPSIAVLPFQNIGGDPDQDYFADGFVEEIVVALSRFRWLFVIARNSSFAYKNKRVDIRQIGRELGVRYVLEGSVRKAADQIRITGQLIDATSGAHLWADRYEGGLVDIFSLQDEMTVNVVSAIEPKLLRTEIELALRRRSNDLSAYDLYLRGFAHFFTMTREGLETALRLFSDAFKIDDRYAAAALMAGECHSLNVGLGWAADPKAELEEATRLVRLALSLDPNDPEVLGTAGRMAAYFDGDYAAAIDLVDRAVMLNPNSSLAWFQRGWTCIYSEQPTEALRSLERSIRLSPLDPVLYLMFTGIAFACISLHRFEDAVAAARKAIRENDQFAPAFRTLAVALAHLGRDDEARVAAGQLLRLEPNFRISEWLGRAHRYQPGHFIDGLRKAGLPE